MRGVVWAGLVVVGLGFGPAAKANCRFEGRTYSKGKKIRVYPSASVPFGEACRSTTLVCRTKGSRKKRRSNWYLRSRKLESVSGYSSSCTVQEPAPSCPARKVSVNYSFSDADRDGYFKPESGSVCLPSRVRLPTVVRGVRYASTVASNRIEPAECDSDRSGVVAVNYGAVDRDGDGYFIAESGRTCLMSATLPQTKQTTFMPRATFAAVVPTGKAETSAAADQDSLDPIGPFFLVDPSTRASGASNGHENLGYETFVPGLGFHYLNTVRAENAWSPDFSNHGLRLVSVVGGSRQFGYSVYPVSGGEDPAETAGAPESAQIDRDGRALLLCGTMPGTEFELRVRDLKTGFEQTHRFFSAGDGPACAPDPEPTHTPELCLDPSAMNYWTEGECAYPEPTPTPTETSDPGPEPTPEPTPTEEDPCGEIAFEEMSGEERASWRASELEAAKSQAVGKNFGNLVFLNERIHEPKNSGPLPLLPHRYGHCLTYRIAKEESGGAGRELRIHRTRYTTYDISPKGTDNNGSGGIWRRRDYSHATNYGSGAIDDPLSVAVSPELGVKYGDLLFDSDFGWLRVESQTSADLDPNNRVDYWLGKPDPAPPHWKTQWEASAAWESYEKDGSRHQFTGDVTLLHFPGGIVSKGFLDANPGRRIPLPGSSGNLIGK